jgi:four helix bundle protein
MMKENPIRDKSFDFALRIVKLYQFLAKEQQEFVMSKQLLRSGTSIGANVREGEQAESKADFIHKMAIALKEANETEYWLLLLSKSGYLSEKAFQSIDKDLKEILKILIAIVKTSKENK